MIDLKSKTAIVVDNGLFCDLAARLGRDFGKVYYWAPAYSGFPKPNISWVGKGIDGIEVINDPFGNVYDKADIWIFPEHLFRRVADPARITGEIRLGVAHGRAA